MWLDNIIDGAAWQIAQAVLCREVSAEEICREFLRRAEADECGAYITLMSEDAVTVARGVDVRVAEGDGALPLAGVPFSVKDNICTCGTRTTCASKLLKDFIPSYDATVYQRLLEAGAVPVGKTNMDEFAVGSDGTTSYFGRCKNPLDPSRTPGGSSSGSAASLAAHTVPLSLGSDTGGSARVPASFCGLVALKPTYGSVSRYGLVGMAPSLEQICPMTHTVRDNKLMFDVIRGQDARDMTTLSVNRCTRESDTQGETKLGIFLPDGASDAAVNAVRSAVASLTRAGYEPGEITLPMFEDVLGVYYTISSAEASSNLARFDGVRYGYRSSTESIIDTRTEGFGPCLRERLAEGAYVLTQNNGGTYVRALEMQSNLRGEMAKLFEKYDVVITPMADSVAPLFGDDGYYGEKYAVYANLTGIPAISVPSVMDEGLPVGVQLLAPWGREDILYMASEIVESGRCL